MGNLNDMCTALGQCDFEKRGKGNENMLMLFLMSVQPVSISRLILGMYNYTVLCGLFVIYLLFSLCDIFCLSAQM